MKFLNAFSFLILLANCASGQNLIGYTEPEIRKYMRENVKDMNLNKVNNDKFTYLKYSDNSDSQTMLFFLSKDSVCQSIRIICDENAKAKRMKEFDSAFKKDRDNMWIDTRGGRKYLIQLKEDKWANVITMEPFK